MIAVTPSAVILSFLAALASLGMAAYAWPRRHIPGAGPFALLLCASSIWTSASALTTTRHDLPSAVAIFNIGQSALSFVPILWLLVALHYTGRRSWLRPPRLGLLLLIPLAFIVLFWTDGLHNLVRRDLVLLDSNGLTYLDFQRGPVFWLFAAYTYLLCLSTLPLYVDAIVHRPFKGQPVALLVTMLLPLIWYGLFFLGIVRYRPLGASIVTFPLSGLVMGWALFRHHLFQIAPVARDWVIESMPDAVFVLDPANRIVDLNPSANELLGLARAAVLGRPATQVLAAWPDLLAAVSNDQPPRGEIQFRGQGSAEPRFLDLHVNDLKDRDGQPAGRVLVLRDVTARRSAERDIAEANRQLRIQLDRVHDLQSRLREEAIRDSLTGLFNRRYLQEVMETELESARLNGHSVSLIMLDIDHFKDVNDSHGHAAGDLMLQHLGALVLGHVRAGDIACRYGGEEIVVVLPAAPLQVAARRAEELRAQVAAVRLPYQRAELTATLSVGVAAYPDHGRTADELMRAADNALYAAKAQGRNRVVVQTDATQPEAVAE